jgi:FixJ family two-component response regulator
MILIVDDDQSIRTSLTRLLRSAGYEARAFADAEEYVRYVSGTEAAANCLILDLHLPGMSGLDLQEIVNRREPAVPVIILTATQDPELLVKALTAGAAKVLRKPCDSTVLLGAIAAAVGQAPPPSPCARLAADTTAQFGTNCDPDHFVLEKGHGIYRPKGCVSFDQAVALIRGAVAAARRHEVRDLLVDTTALIGFPTPDTFERFLAAVEWAEEAKGGVRLAMVARPEMIHPQKFGVLVAANKGLMSNIFSTEVEARAWLNAWNGH